MKYWLIKSEGDCYPIDFLKKDKVTPWSGIRNYQARNFMRDDMSVGDLCLFYHSNAEPSGVYGVAKVASKPYPDATAFDKKDEHYDPMSSSEKPTWILVDMKYVSTLKNPVSLSDMKKTKALDGMLVTQKGMRLSIQPVSEKHFKKVIEMGS
jgi:predicted RNA-binding protein with PUA-like domain